MRSLSAGVLALMRMIRVRMVLRMQGLVTVPSIGPMALRMRMPTTKRVRQNVEEHVTKH